MNLNDPKRSSKLKATKAKFKCKSDLLCTLGRDGGFTGFSVHVLGLRNIELFSICINLISFKNSHSHTQSPKVTHNQVVLAFAYCRAIGVSGAKSSILRAIIHLLHVTAHVTLGSSSEQKSTLSLSNYIDLYFSHFKKSVILSASWLVTV